MDSEQTHRAVGTKALSHVFLAADDGLYCVDARCNHTEWQLIHTPTAKLGQLIEAIEAHRAAYWMH